MPGALVQSCNKAARRLNDAQSVHIISHNDADGLTAGGIMCHAMYRTGTLFNTSIVKSLDRSVIDRVNESASSYDVIVFCDMGSGNPELIKAIEKDCIIIDHHRPVDGHTCIHVNPHLAGIDGALELSASGTAYFVAREIAKVTGNIADFGGNNHSDANSGTNSNTKSTENSIDNSNTYNSNIDLAGLAITGAVGDMQKISGADSNGVIKKGTNCQIFEEAISHSIIKSHKGMKMGSGDIKELFMCSIDPFLDISGNESKIDAFLVELGVSGNIDDLDDEQYSRLATAVMLKLLKHGGLDILDSCFGDVFTLNNEVVKNVHDFMWMLTACGKFDMPAIGLSLCLRDNSMVSKARGIAFKYRKQIVSEVIGARDKVSQDESLRYVILDNSDATGHIASTLIRYHHPDKPFLTLNRKDGSVRISARGTPQLINAGLDLSVVLSKAAKSVGGGGGGHNIASGAGIPLGKESDFLKMASEIVKEQMNR